MLFCHLSGMFLNYLWDSYQHRPLLGKYSIEANSNQLKIKKKILSDKVKLEPPPPSDWCTGLGWVVCSLLMFVLRVFFYCLVGNPISDGCINPAAGRHLLFDLQLSYVRVAGATNGQWPDHTSCLTSTFCSLQSFLGSKTDFDWRFACSLAEKKIYPINVHFFSCWYRNQHCLKSWHLQWNYKIRSPLQWFFKTK